MPRSPGLACRLARFVALTLLPVLTSVAQRQPEPVAGQAVAPAQTEQGATNAPATAAGTKATMYVYRLRNHQGMFNKPSVYIDDKELGRIGNGRFFVVNVASGRHVVRSVDKASTVRLEMQPSQVYFLSVAVEKTQFTFRFETVLVPPDQGWSEIGQTEPNDSKDIKDNELAAIGPLPPKPASAPAPAEDGNVPGSCRSITVTRRQFPDEGFKVVDVVNYPGAYVGKWYDINAMPTVARYGVRILLLTKGYTPEDLARAHNFCQSPEGTVADSQLAADITGTIRTLEVADHPGCELQIVKQLHSADKPGVERWDVKSCDAASSYDVQIVPSPKGGSDFRAVKSKSVQTQEKITDTAAPPPRGSETEPSAALSQEPKPEVKTGEIKEGKQYSSKGMFSITVPPRNWAVDTYKFRGSQLKYENYDYEEVVFYIPDFGQAYGAGVRRIPQAALAQMAKEEEKQTLANLAHKALFQWREGYAEEPQPVEENSVQTQFGEGLLRIYLAKRSSMIEIATGGGRVGDLKGERVDTHIAVLVVKKGAWFIYATAEDDDLQRNSIHGPGAPFDPKPILAKALKNFFASMTVIDLIGKASLPSPELATPTSPPSPPPQAATADASSEVLVPYEGQKSEFTIAIPKGWVAQDQSQTLGKGNSRFNLIIFHQPYPTLTGQDAKSLELMAMKQLTGIDSGEIPSFFVQRVPAKNGMSCAGFPDKAEKDVFKMISSDPILGKGAAIQEAPYSEPVTVAGCKGIRIRGTGQPAKETTAQTIDVYAVSDGKMLYLFTLRNHADNYKKNAEVFQKSMATAKLTAAQ